MPAKKHNQFIEQSTIEHWSILSECIEHIRPKKIAVISIAILLPQSHIYCARSTVRWSQNRVTTGDRKQEPGTEVFLQRALLESRHHDPSPQIRRLRPTPARAPSSSDFRRRCIILRHALVLPDPSTFSTAARTSPSRSGVVGDLKSISSGQKLRPRDQVGTRYQKRCDFEALGLQTQNCFEDICLPP